MFVASTFEPRCIPLPHLSRQARTLKESQDVSQCGVEFRAHTS